ncbi:MULTISPECIES: class I SAM-dependent methyltransferase [Kocuria]|nr:class I SAM-dependent methyltransferase [Kocuria indica]MBN6811596.1 class I SAM-dependent methyltransferase [Kocuria indica]MBN6843290.1 class I SAM-dependent methyltransferase [Kocuria indica]
MHREGESMPRMSALEASCCRSAPWSLLARRMVPWATQGFPVTENVLEIGGGSGAMAEAIVQANPWVRLTTTDADPVMVEVAQQCLVRFPHAEACQADATRLPFEDESFDTVVSFLMLHHVIEWEHAVVEGSRVLRPGGALVGYDLLASRMASLVHRADRSPHRLIDPGAFEPVLDQVGLELLALRLSFGGRILRFVAQKPATR